MKDVVRLLGGGTLSGACRADGVPGLARDPVEGERGRDGMGLLAGDRCGPADDSHTRADQDRQDGRGAQHGRDRSLHHAGRSSVGPEQQAARRVRRALRIGTAGARAHGGGTKTGTARASRAAATRPASSDPLRGARLQHIRKREADARHLSSGLRAQAAAWRDRRARRGVAVWQQQRVRRAQRLPRRARLRRRGHQLPAGAALAVSGGPR